MPTYYYSMGPGKPFVRIPMRLLTDPTLTKKGYAADAAVVGAALKSGGGGFNVEDDGDGNVTITSHSSVSITDDGAGNVTIK